MGLNPTEEEVQQMILESDTDKDGYIDFIEFLELMKKLWGVIDKVLLTILNSFRQLECKEKRFVI